MDFIILLHFCICVKSFIICVKLWIWFLHYWSILCDVVCVKLIWFLFGVRNLISVWSKYDFSVKLWIWVLREMNLIDAWNYESGFCVNLWIWFLTPTIWCGRARSLPRDQNAPLYLPNMFQSIVQKNQKHFLDGASALQCIFVLLHYYFTFTGLA